MDATTAYWPADSVTLQRLGTKPRVFALDQFGGPRYPGLVAFVGRTLRESDPAHATAFAEALAHGERDVIADPAAGLKATQDSYPELDASITEAQLRNYVPLFGTADTAGTLSSADLTEFAKFAAESKLTERALTVPELLSDPDPGTTP